MIKDNVFGKSEGNQENIPAKKHPFFSWHCPAYRLIPALLLCLVALLIANPIIIIVIDLLDGRPYSEDYRWTGSPGDRLGASLSEGDVDGDGYYRDIIIGAPGASTGAGKVYLFLGGDNLNTDIPDLTVIGDSGQPHGSLGSSVAAGDINGDGLADMIIGCPGASNGGSVYIIYGSASLPDTIDLGGVAPSCLVHAGAGGDLLGQYVWSGDIDRDGFDDLLLAAPAADPKGRQDAGAVYVIRGRGDLPGEIFLGQGGADWMAIGAFAYDSLGSAVAVGDLNGDGMRDVALGVPAADPVGLNAGRVYLLYGRETFPDTLDLFLDADVHFIGAAAGDRSGSSVCFQQVGGDERGNLLIGSPGSDRYIPDGGVVNIFFGRESFPSVIDLGTDGGDIVIFSSRGGERIGEAVAAGMGTYSTYAGCIAVGAPYATPDDTVPDRDGAGVVYLSDNDLLSAEFDISAGVLIEVLGGNPSDHVGSPLILANTIYSRGDDMLIGAPDAGGGSGEVYLVKDAEITGIEEQHGGRGNHLPRAPLLGQNHPNPFNPSTTIEFNLTEDVGLSEVHLEVFTVRGRKVRTLVDGSRPLGLNEVHWDGLDDRGARVGSGIYIYRLDIGGRHESRKMFLRQ